MCGGSVAGAAPPIALPLGQLLIPTVPRESAAGGDNQKAASAIGAETPRTSANPNLGKHVDIAA